MSGIDPGGLPVDTVVETRGEHFARDQVHLTTAKDVYQRGDLTILRAFVPVPAGVTVEDATRALDALDPETILVRAVAAHLEGSINASFEDRARGAISLVRASEATR